MKAILIDVKKKEVREVEIEKGKRSYLDSMYQQIGCNMIETALYLDDTDSPDAIMVDEEGMLNFDNNTMFFTFEGGHQPFAGNGLVIGSGEGGGTVAAKSTVAEIYSKVKFHTLAEVRKMV